MIAVGAGVAAIFTSLGVGLAIQPPLIAWLLRHDILDLPNERSSHDKPTPKGGGLGILMALCIGFLAAQWRSAEDAGAQTMVAVIVGSLVLGAVGFADDIREIRAVARLAIQFAVGALAGLLVPSQFATWLAVPMLAIWVASYVNAFNFMDGIDGISAMSGAVAGCSYALLGWQFDSYVVVALGAALCGASFSFLPYSFPRARVFPGDAGSYAVGFVIALLAWLVWTSGAPPLLALAPTAVYLLDTGTTLVRRARAGQSLFEAHRSHVYQVLAADGRSHATVALLVAAFQALVVAVVWWGYWGGHALSGVLLAGSILAVYASLPRLDRSPSQGSGR